MYSRAQFEEDMEQIEQDSQGISRLVAAGKMSGLESLAYTKMIDNAKLKCKGRLFGTRMILADGDKKSKCADKKNHVQLCYCKKLHKFQAEQENENAE
jgi:hypothetical protein